MPSRVGPLPVLFLTGAPGCGKGSVCHWLEKECGFFVVTVDEAASSTVRGVECVFDDALRRAGGINIDIDVMPICVSALPSRLIFERFQNAVSCTAPLNAFAASARRVIDLKAEDEVKARRLVDTGRSLGGSVFERSPAVAWARILMSKVAAPASELAHIRNLFSGSASGASSSSYSLHSVSGASSAAPGRGRGRGLRPGHRRRRTLDSPPEFFDIDTTRMTLREVKRSTAALLGLELAPEVEAKLKKKGSPSSFLTAASASAAAAAPGESSSATQSQSQPLRMPSLCPENFRAQVKRPSQQMQSTARALFDPKREDAMKAADKLVGKLERLLTEARVADEEVREKRFAPASWVKLHLALFRISILATRLKGFLVAADGEAGR